MGWENFNIEKEEPRLVEVPVNRANYGSPCLVFSRPNHWGSGLKVALRQCAKKLPEYYLKLKNPPTLGDEILVDTLGRWAWGIPGYMGHLIFCGPETSRIIIYYPEGSPKELLTLLEKSVRMLT